MKRMAGNAHLLALSVLLIFIGEIASGNGQQTCPIYMWKNQRGVIESPSYPAYYPANSCAVWYIRGPRRTTVTVSIQKLNLPKRLNGECTDSLQLGPAYIPAQWSMLPINQTVCGDKPLVVLGYIIQDFFIIGFQSTKDSPGGQFRLEWTMSNDINPGPCRSSEFKCRNSKCIPARWRCNGLDECLDGKASDEESCTTTAASTTTTTTQATTRAPSAVPFTYRMQMNRFTAGVLQLPSVVASMHCPCIIVWTITLPVSAANVQLRITQFSLAAVQGQSFVRVYSIFQHHKRFLGQFYDSPPPIIESRSKSMIVELHSSVDLQLDSFVATYQKKGLCINNQTACGAGENDCYELKHKCDGERQCRLHGGDEAGCSSTLCSQKKGLYLCCDRRCVRTQEKCGHVGVCVDYNVSSPSSVTSEGHTRIILAMVTGSLVCSLLLVLALGCSCKIYFLRNAQRSPPRRCETPLSRLQAELLRRRVPPPSYNEAMQTSRSYDEVRQEYLAFLRSERQQGGSTAVADDPENPGERTEAAGSNAEPGGVAISVNSTNTPANWTLDRTSSTAQLILPVEASSDSENGESDGEGEGRLEEEESVQMETLQTCGGGGRAKEGEEEGEAPCLEAEPPAIAAEGSKPSTAAAQQEEKSVRPSGGSNRPLDAPRDSNSQEVESDSSDSSATGRSYTSVLL